MLKADYTLLLKEWKKTLLFALLILLVFFLFRLVNLNSIPVFADEAIYVRWAQVMRAEPTLRFVPLSDGKQPLFMWTVIPFLKVLSDPLIAGRIVSVLSGLATLVGIFLLTLRVLRSKKAAFLAALFYAVSPFAVFFDRMALVDAMLTAFGIWALYFAVLTAQTLRLDFAMLAGFALGGAWLTKSPALFFLLLLPASAILVDWKKGERLARTIKLVGLWLVSWAIAFGMYNILRLGPNFHMIAARNQDYVFELSHAFTNPFDPLQFHIKEIIAWLFVLLPGTVLLLSLYGLWQGRKKYFAPMLLLLAWILFPLLVQAEFAKVFTARYILFTIPPLFVLAALPASYAASKLKKGHLAAALALVLLPSFYINFLALTAPEKAPLPRRERHGYLEEWTAGTGIREVASHIRRESVKNPEQQIVVGTEGFFGTLPDGLQIYLEKIPNITVIGVGVTISDVHPSLLEAKKAGNKVFFVINSTRFTGNPDQLGLRLIESYPKAQRPDGTRESLLFFEVTDEALRLTGQETN